MVQLFHFERCGVSRTAPASSSSHSHSHSHACSGEMEMDSIDREGGFEILGRQPQRFHVVAVNSVHAQLQHQEASLLLSLAYCMQGRVQAGVAIVKRLITMLQEDSTTHHIQELHHPTDFWLSLSYYHLAICQQQQQERGTVKQGNSHKERMESPCPSLHESLRRGSGVKNAETGHLQAVRNLLSQICLD